MTDHDASRSLSLVKPAAWRRRSASATAWKGDGEALMKDTRSEAAAEVDEAMAAASDVDTCKGVWDRKCGGNGEVESVSLWAQLVSSRHRGARPLTSRPLHVSARIVPPRFGPGVIVRLDAPFALL